jgi:hypothetical protein
MVRMNEKILFFVILLVVLIAIMFSATSQKVLAATNDTVTIDVNVSSISQITLLPDSLSWVLIGAGTEGGHKNITLKNTGSLNVSQIYAYVDTLTDESARPYGSSDPSLYAAGGVLTMRNETDTNYYFLGRIEWNWTQDIPNHVWSSVTSPIAWGYFRNTTNDYVWLVGNGTDGYCNNTATQFALEDDIDVGISVTRTPTTGSITNNANDTNWTYFSVLRTPFNDRACVAVYYDCTKIYIYSWDKRTSPNFDGCTAADYLYSGSGTENPLSPGSTIILKVNPWIPYGTPAGDLNTATLTVIAT